MLLPSTGVNYEDTGELLKKTENLIWGVLQTIKNGTLDSVPMANRYYCIDYTNVNIVSKKEAIKLYHFVYIKFKLSAN